MVLLWGVKEYTRMYLMHFYPTDLVNQLPYGTPPTLMLSPKSAPRHYPHPPPQGRHL